jgi:hypothetical protein
LLEKIETIVTTNIGINNNNKRSFNFVIVGTITHQSRDDALEYIKHLLKKDSKVTDSSIIHVFGEY